MSDKKLAVLGIIAVILAGLAVLQGRMDNQRKPGRIVVSPLIEGLDPDAVKTVRMTSQQGKETITLTRGEESIGVAEKNMYPADMKKVNELISGCLDMRTASDSWITDNPENHAELGVTGDTARYAIDFLGEQDAVIAGVLISEPRTEKEGEQAVQYARLADKNDVYLVQDVPYFSIEPMGYIDSQLFQLERDDISQVTVTDPNRASYTLYRPDGGSEIVLENMPEGKRLNSDHRTVFNSLSYLRMDDVLPLAETDIKFDSSYTCKLKNGVVYTVKMAEKEGKTYVRLAARYTGTEPSVQKQVESEEQLKEREKLFLAKDTADAFMKKHEGWVYQIPDYKAKEMKRPLGDILEDKPEEKAAAEIEGADSAEQSEE